MYYTHPCHIWHPGRQSSTHQENNWISLAINIFLHSGVYVGWPILESCGCRGGSANISSMQSGISTFQHSQPVAFLSTILKLISLRRNCIRIKNKLFPKSQRAKLEGNKISADSFFLVSCPLRFQETALSIAATWLTPLSLLSRLITPWTWEAK